MKWLIGANMLWLPMLLSTPCRQFLTSGESCFAALAFVSYTSVFAGTTDAALRKTVLRLVGASLGCFLAYTGYLLLAWPTCFGDSGQALVLIAYLCTVLMLFIHLGMRSAAYEGGWHTWAYACQKFSYTFAGVFLSVYRVDLHRADLIDKAGRSAFACACGIWVGAFWGCFVHLSVWRTSAAKQVEEALRSTAAATAKSLTIVAGALFWKDDSERDAPASENAAAAARIAAAAAREQVKTAEAKQKAAVEFAGKFLGSAAHRRSAQLRAARVPISGRLFSYSLAE